MFCNQELYDVITRGLEGRKSKAASVPEEMITIPMKEYMDLKDKKCANVITQTVRQSKAASEQPGINQAKVIYDFITKGH